MDTFFYIEAQKRSRVTKLGAQTQHRVVLRFVPPSASKQSEIILVRPSPAALHEDAFCKYKSIAHLLFDLATCSAVNILYFLVHAIDGLGGGCRRNSW